MREIWRRIREAFEESMRQQITALGFVFTLTVVLVGFAAFVSGNNLLFLLLAALLSTLAYLWICEPSRARWTRTGRSTACACRCATGDPGHYQDPQSQVPDALLLAAPQRRAGNRLRGGHVHPTRSGAARP